MLDAENASDAAESSAANPVTTDEADASRAAEATAEAAMDTTGDGSELAPAKKAAAKRTAAKKTTVKKATTKKTASKRTAKKAVDPTAADVAGEAGATAAVDDTTAPAEAASAVGLAAAEGPDESAAAPAAAGEASAAGEAPEGPPAAKRPARKTAKKTAAKRTTKKAAAEPGEPTEPTEGTEGTVGTETSDLPEVGTPQAADAETSETAAAAAAGQPSATALLFQPPDVTKAVTRRRRSTKPAESAETEPGAEDRETGEPKPAKKAAKKPAKKAAAKSEEKPAEEHPEGRTAPTEEAAREDGEENRQAAGAEGEEEQAGERRRRRRGGRRRRRSGGGDDTGPAEPGEEAEANGPREGQNSQGSQAEAEEGEEGSGGTRRRRRRRRSGENGEDSESEGTVTRARKPRNAEDEITALSGSTRLEAKKQRRREGREAGRRRAPIVSEAEFLARRESVDRVMVIRQREDLTQIAVLEDKVLVEHYVARESQTSLIGNVYLGRVQNVLPSMEAAFIDIGKGRNAVLYAGEVNWDALGAKNGQPRKIEAVLKSGQSILVQVTKDPIGHKGARLTSQISLPGRFLVYVPDGTTSGISRKLPDTERNRLKALLKDIVPETAGVIVRTAAEGASEEELTRDVERLTARWTDIESKVKGGNAPQLLYGEPDLTLKVVRDLFTEDFSKLVIAGDDAWDMVEGYVSHVAPDLAERLERYDGERDVFAEYRIDEQIEKALDRKVWLPSGGSLVIDRTEAMTVVDVNTGKFTGSGGNLEETVTKNNLEAAEEIVRQLRLRDIGGIIVVDFIDMVLESNRDLVLRRLVECLGRDRTRHQVAEVTSLGLVQMTRKRIGTGLLEAFSETCEHCQGRGLVLHHEPVEPRKKGEDESRRGRRSGRGRGHEEAAAPTGGNSGGVPSPKDIAAMAKPEDKHEEQADQGAEPSPGDQAAGHGEGRGEDARREPAETESVEQRSAEAQTAGARGGGRSRGRRGRGQGVRDDQAETEPQASSGEPAVAERTAVQPGAAEQAEAEQPEDEQPKGEEQAPTEEATPEPAAPAAPRIVTSVRRRSARRPAGPPTGATGTPSTTGEPLAAVNGTVAPSADGHAAVAAGDGIADEPSDTDPIASLVEDAEVDADATTDDENGDMTGVDVAATPHVPVKKKGSRRR